MVDKLPSFIKNLIGDTARLATPEGFFNLQPFSMMAPLLFLIYGIGKGADTIAGEKERDTLDLLLANPVSRTQVILEKFAAISLSLFTVAIIFWLGLMSATMIFSISICYWRLFAVIFSCFLLGLTFASLTMLVSCLLLKKKISIGIISALAVVTYLTNAYAPMVPALKPYSYFTPFYYYNGATPLISGLNIFHVLVQLALMLIFLTSTIIFFNKKDLVS